MQSPAVLSELQNLAEIAKTAMSVAVGTEFAYVIPSEDLALHALGAMLTLFETDFIRFFNTHAGMIVSDTQEILDHLVNRSSDKSAWAELGALKLSKDHKKQVEEMGRDPLNKDKKTKECLTILKQYGERWGLTEARIRAFRSSLKEGKHATLVSQWPQYRDWDYWSVCGHLNDIRRARNDLCHTCVPPVDMPRCSRVADSLIALYRALGQDRNPNPNPNSMPKLNPNPHLNPSPSPSPNPNPNPT